VLNDSLEALKYLLSKGLNINEKDFLGETILFDLSRKSKNAFLLFVLSNGANSKLANNSVELPIHLACKKGNIDTIKILLESNSPLDKKTNQGLLPIHYCLSNDNVDLFNFVIKESKFELTTLDERRNSLLHYCCKYGSLSLSKYLLSYQLNVNGLNDFYETPLFYAIKSANLELIKLLLTHGAYIDLENRRYETPLMLASMMDENILKIIQNYSDSIEYQKYIHDSLLIYYTLKRDYNMVKKLILEHTALTKDRYNKTALDYAKEYNLNTIISILLGRI
jgi:ankyrin repeat protein